MDVLHQLKTFLAKHYVKLYQDNLFIGLTGSVGKTSTVLACQAVLSQKYKTIATKPNLDPLLNISETILRIKPGTQKVILEMNSALALVKPKTMVVTRISNEDNFEEKVKLIEQLPKDGLAILNYDDLNSRKLAEKCQGTVMYYGTDPANCSVWAGNIRIKNFKTIFELNHGVERVQVEYSLLGEHQIYSALAAAALGLALQVSLTKIKIALEQVRAEEHSLSAVSGPNGSIILDDTSNCLPIAVEAAIETLGKLPARRRIIVLGEMRDLGKHSEKLHREVAQKIFKEKIDLVLLGQGETQYLAEELNSLGFWEDRIETNLQNSQIVAKLLTILGKGDICLIKGARSIRLDEVVKRVENKN